MTITTKLTIDVAKRQILEKVDVVQCDANTRAVAVTLTAGGLPWVIDNQILTVSVACKKPDGTSAWYDTLPDGTVACSVEKNVVTAILAPEVLTAAGQVKASIVFQDPYLNQLATFPFIIAVEENPAAGSVISNSYYNLQTLAEINEDIDSIHDDLGRHAMYFAQQAGDIQQNMRKIDELIYKFGKVISDSSVASDSTWSSKKIDESLAAVEASAAQDFKATAIVCTAEGEQIEARDSADYPLQSLTVYGKSVQDGTPTPDAPVPIVSAGANGRIVVGATADQSNSVYLLHPCSVTYRDGDTAIFTIAVKDAFSVSKIQWYYRSSESGAWEYANAVGGAVGDDTYTMQITLTEAMNGYQFATQVNLKDGNKEVSQPATVTLGEKIVYHAPAGAVVMSTPGGLLGIPVTSGGNYTDENGQQWLSDTLTEQVLLHAVFDGSEDEGWKHRTDVNDHLFSLSNPFGAPYAYTKNVPCMTNYGYNGTGEVNAAYEGVWVFWIGDKTSYTLYFKTSDCNSLEEFRAKLAAQPLDVIIQAAEPVVKELDAEAAAAIKALHSYKPNTTIINDAGAGMKVEYVADPKTYIDNKFAELATAMAGS